MKNSIIWCLLMLFSTTAIGQLQWGTRDSFPWVKLNQLPSINGKFKTTTEDVYKAIDFDRGLGWIRDSMFYKQKFTKWENTISSGKGGTLLSRSVVKSAKRKNPGNDVNAILKRHKLYHQKLLSKLD